MAGAPVQLSAANSTLLPPKIIEPIFKLASESSAVMSLARKVPLSVAAATAIPVPMDVPTAGWVAEGGVKSVGSAGVGIKLMTGKKVALLVPVSEELVLTNPAGLYDQLVQDLPTAIGRAFDTAAIHGTDLKTGGAGPFGDYLGMTPNSQVIGSTAASAGGVYADLVKGVQQVVNAPISGYNFSGFAADPRLKPELMLSVDTVGRPLALSQDQGALGPQANLGSIIGYPAAYNTGVSGKYYRQGDAVQTVTINGSPTGGTFTLNVVGQSTGPLAYNATGATLQTAIQGLGTAAAANATVSGSAGGPYTITFGGAAAPISANSALTGGTSPSVSVAQSPAADTGLRAIGGDFSQCAYGVGMDISVRISREANYWDGSNWHSAFQENLVLLLVEAYYGFVVGDKNAFVAYTHAAGS
jgi:hypothetical protein